MKTELPLLASAQNLDHIRLCIYDDFREYLTRINLLPPSTGTTTGEQGWKHHERNTDISFFPWIPSCDCRAQYIQLWIPTLFTFHVVTVISKNITKKGIYRQDSTKKKLNLIMMESRKGKTREVTRNTCNTTELHLQELTGSKIWWWDFIVCFKR